MKEKRSCYNCKNSRLCFAFRSIHDTISTLPKNIDGDAAPGRASDIFDAVGNCCLEFAPSNNIVEESGSKRLIDDWIDSDKIYKRLQSSVGTRLYRCISEFIEMVGNVYVEDITKTDFMKIKGAGKATWQEFVRLRDL